MATGTPASSKPSPAPLSSRCGQVLVEAADADGEAQRRQRLPLLLAERLEEGRRLSHRRLGLRRGVALLLVVDHLLVEGEALVVQRVAHLVALGAQVGLVVGVGGGLDRHLLGDREPVALEADDLFRVVGEDADAGQAEVAEDLGADPVVAQVGGQAELEVGLDRVGALLLQLVGAQLVEQADPAPLLGEVEEDAPALAARSSPAPRPAARRSRSACCGRRRR